ncbi:molybdopterin-guanine dinucleotide biosynthesis protein B [Paenibacillus phyllosphaerae]|uniref:Molybdopterin-guanine dinucleotide biosynthesis protein B n=1 Tax=Paenibacillus phyllosphaerae TaxID=274593 RepID=A0A7W5B5B9_9BACL|nr:molybdopterin-guanine dinucleotide biosynthesis protein B [Paenibacillus phyllosphaerae]MBB3114708.1 molybdopterin-guanine dinucleotide biosynthesis protein B [Paenibacillus phyllosphaerae]
MSIANDPYVLQIVGYKNSGKTTLVQSLIRRLKTQDLTVGTVKHDAHDFTMDTPGTDTWKHQEAGADVTAISSASRSAVLYNQAASLDTLLTRMTDIDLVLVEGFKQAHYPKFVLLRDEGDLKLLSSLTQIEAVLLGPGAEGLQPSLAPRYAVYKRDDADGITRRFNALFGQARL